MIKGARTCCRLDEIQVETSRDAKVLTANVKQTISVSNHTSYHFTKYGSGHLFVSIIKPTSPGVIIITTDCITSVVKRQAGGNQPGSFENIAHSRADI